MTSETRTEPSSSDSSGEKMLTQDYRNAPSGIGPLAADWADKPHRLVYDLCAAIESLQHDLSRHLSITSEQATEILGKEKDIEAARAERDNAENNCGHEYERAETYKAEVERQSILLKKAETALERISKLPNDYDAAHVVDTRKSLIENAALIARAVLSELQLKGK